MTGTISYFNSICVSNRFNEYTISLVVEPTSEEVPLICITDIETGDQVFLDVDMIVDIISSINTMKDIAVWHAERKNKNG